MQGIRGLGRAKAPSHDDLAALSAIVTDTSTPTPLRVEAARALGSLKDAASIGSLATSTLDRWEVREAVLDAVAAVSGPDQASPISRERGYKVLLRAWERDPSTKVRAAAIRGLATIKADLDTIVAATKVESQDDEIRRSAMRALVSLNAPAGLRAVIDVTKLGNLSRTRAEAIGHVVILAEHDREAAFEAVAACVNDREQRARLAAGQALADLKDLRGVDLLTKRLGKAKNATERRAIESWITAIGIK
jgi:hypothetical protein